MEKHGKKKKKKTYRKEEIRQVRVVNITRKINSGNDRNKYELDIVPFDIKENGNIIEGEKETIIVPEETIMEMIRQTKGLFDGKEKEDENEKIMYG